MVIGEDRKTIVQSESYDMFDFVPYVDTNETQPNPGSGSQAKVGVSTYPSHPLPPEYSAMR